MVACNGSVSLWGLDTGCFLKLEVPRSERRVNQGTLQRRIRRRQGQERPCAQGRLIVGNVERQRDKISGRVQQAIQNGEEWLTQP